MKQPRATPRFKVGVGFPLTVFIPQSVGKNFQLRTIGEGGFGIMAPFRESNLMSHPVIDVRFTFAGRALNMKGTVQYCTFLPKQGSSYVGIKFHDCDPRQELILKSIIQAALKKGHIVDELAAVG